MTDNDQIPEDQVIEAYIVEPLAMADSDWDLIHENAKNFSLRGETDWLKCCVLGYLEWADVDIQKLRRQ